MAQSYAARSARSVSTLILALLLPASAHAVLGDASVSVKDVSSQAVAGATVKLVPKQPGGREVTAQTDASGNAQLKAEEGDYEVIAIVGGREKSVGEVRILQSHPARLDAVFDPIVKSAATTPLGLSVGPYYAFQLADWNLGPEVETVISGGTTTVIPNSSAGNDFRSKLQAGGVQIGLGTPSFDLLGLNVQPSVDLALGGGSLEIDVDPADFSLEGVGPMIGTGASFTIRRPRDPWYGIVEYRFGWMSLEMDRMPCSPPAPPPVSCQSNSEIVYKSHQTGAQLGYSFGPVGLHAGAGYAHGHIWNDTAIDRIFTTTGGTVQVQNLVDQELTRSKVEGIVGLDAGWGPLFGRAETRFNAHDVSVFFTLSTGLP